MTSEDTNTNLVLNEVFARARVMEMNTETPQNSTFSEDLPTDQSIALAVLLCGGTQAEAAAEAGLRSPPNQR